MLYLRIPACASYLLAFQHNSLKGTDSEPKKAHERKDFHGGSLVCTAHDVTFESASIGTCNIIVLQPALAKARSALCEYKQAHEVGSLHFCPWSAQTSSPSTLTHIPAVCILAFWECDLMTGIWHGQVHMLGAILKLESGA